ncbi:MAG TPA: hypothetical protein PLS50_01650 [Candidatus Dojkabacteria bacterium]|nr:hypothetical protein [Candidatus Dojkabacteria bacterium]
MENTKPVKKSITDKQKDARRANLAAGRKKKAEMLQKKKEEQVYDLSSNGSVDESDSETEDESFVVSKRKPVKKQTNDELKQDVNELKNMVVELATLQKKQNKELRKTRATRSSGSTKVVVVQPNQPESKPIETNSTLEALRRSLGM